MCHDGGGYFSTHSLVLLSLHYFRLFPIICVVFILYSTPFLRHIIEKEMAKTEIHSLAGFWTRQSGSGGREKLQNSLSELFATAQQKTLHRRTERKLNCWLKTYTKFYEGYTQRVLRERVLKRVDGGRRKVKTNTDWMNKTFKTSKWGLSFDYFFI